MEAGVHGGLTLTLGRMELVAGGGALGSGEGGTLQWSQRPGEELPSESGGAVQQEGLYNETRCSVRTFCL